VSWNDVGSIPTLLVTIGVELDAVDASPNDDGSTPTELVITCGVGALADAAAGEDAEAAGSGGVMSRLSFTTGT